MAQPEQQLASVAPVASAPDVETSALPAPKPEEKPVEVKAPPAKDVPSNYAALAADPTVVMAPIPKEAPPAPKAAAHTESKHAEHKQVAQAEPAPSAPKKSASPAHTASAYYVQAGAYASEERAGRIAQTLDNLGARVLPATIGGHAIYRVRIGPFLDVDQAHAAIAEAQSKGQSDLRIVSE
jgi:cell division protein FtsN